MKVASLAEIIPGFVFRSGLNHDPQGRIAVVQASSINGESLVLDLGSLRRTNEGPDRAKAFAQVGDILIASRGSATAGFKAAVLTCGDVPVLASSSVYILRPTSKRALPEYLALYINSALGQTQLAQLLVGGVTRAVRRADIEGFDLPIPDLSTQELLVKLHMNTQEQAKILHRRNTLNASIFEGTLQIAGKEL